jgi:hypothetical protein
MPQETKLMPCPCGGDAELDRNGSFRRYKDGAIRSCIDITCNKCPVSIRMCHDDYPDLTVEMVIGYWNDLTKNTRTTPPTSPDWIKEASISKENTGEPHTLGRIDEDTDLNFADIAQEILTAIGEGHRKVYIKFIQQILTKHALKQYGNK